MYSLDFGIGERRICLHGTLMLHGLYISRAVESICVMDAATPLTWAQTEKQ